MPRTGRQQQRFTSLMRAAGLGLIALTSAAPASAACFDGLLRHVVPSRSATPIEAMTSVRAMPAVYHPDENAAGGIARVADRDGGHQEAIVGLWEFQLDGAPPDFGTQAWHADGTELMFSAGRNPATGDICQGVWRKTGPRTYSLNHIAMGWDFGSFGLRVHIHALVTVDRSGDSYTGTYSAAAYAVTPQNPFDESNQVGGGSGTIRGTRVKPD